MLIPNKFNGYHNGTRQLHISSGGGGGGPTQTTSTVQNTNIPSYAQPYVETMLGATQKQLFQGTQQPDVTNPDTGEVTKGNFNITGFKPYQAYGGTYDAQGNQTSYDPSKAVAGFSPLQQQAQQGIAGMQMPGQFNQATNYANQAGAGGLNSAAQALGYGAKGSAYGDAGFAAGQQGQQSGLQGQQLGIAGGQMGIAGGAKYGEMGAAAGQKGQELGVAGGAQYGQQGAGYGKQAAGLADPALAYGAQGAGYGQQGAQYGQQGAQYGQQGAGYGQQAAKLADTALGYGQGSADIGKMALEAQATGKGITAQSQELARQQATAGQDYAKQATDPSAIQKYMNPYTQNVVDVQNTELQRQHDIAGTQRGANAARAGAFGGARQAIENAEAQRNLATLKNANQAQGLQQAYQQAQQAQQYGANLGLQGQSAAQSGLGTALQGGQLGLSGLGTALQGQQGALAGVGQAGSMYGLGMQGAQTGIQGAQAGMQGAQTGIQGTQAGLAGVNAANQAYQTGIQGAGMGLQGVNTQLAGTAQGMQGAQVGLQGVDRQLAGVDRQLAGTAQGMQGAQLGMQGAQAGMQGAGMGLQGVQGAQAGYGLANQAGSNLANIGTQQQGAQLGIYGAQGAAGAQQQQLEQAKINQSMQDYANAQQYPLMQLGTMSNMLRGLPMQASTTNQYAAAPNPLTQAVGTIGAGASMYNAMRPGGAAGGLPSEFKYAKGGIASIPRYDMGGEVESQLESMDEKGLASQAKESSSPTIRKMAQRILRERKMGSQPQAPGMRGGGIIAFRTGGGANEEGGEDEAKIEMEKRLAMPAPTTGGIMGATTPPTTPVPYAPQAAQAMQKAPDIPDFMKAQYADTEKRMNAPLSDFMAERRAAMEAAGVADTSEGQQKQRAEMMAEKANMADEKQRQRYMRMAEFFASWGSTPGPTLVAGLNAMQKSIPNIVSDEKEQKKARREIDKSIADLDNATRLEKRGEVDAAMALKLKAAEDMKALNIKFIDYQSRRESDQSSAAASKYSADMQFRSEQLRSQTSALDRAARRETDDDLKRINAYNAASGRELNLISKISDQMKLLAPDYETIKTAEMNAKQNDGKMTPAFVPAYEAAKKKIADQEAVWTKQKEQAARDSELAYSRIRINPQAAKDYTKPGAAPAATPAAAPSGPISGEFSAPTQAHIAALKLNPTQAAAFDLKFGPGAANEYLGK